MWCSGILIQDDRQIRIHEDIILTHFFTHIDQYYMKWRHWTFKIMTKY